MCFLEASNIDKRMKQIRNDINPYIYVKIMGHKWKISQDLLALLTKPLPDIDEDCK